MKLTQPKTLISRPESCENSQEDVLKTLGNKDINESVALSIGLRLLNPYIPGPGLSKDCDFSTKLVGADVLIKICTNLAGWVDTEALVGIRGHVGGKSFEVIKQIGQHEIESDYFSMDDQGIVISGRVRLTLLAYKLKPINEKVSAAHSFSLLMNSYFDQVVTKKLNVPEVYGALYSHHEAKLRETILDNKEDIAVVIREFNEALKSIGENVKLSETELKRFLKALS